MLKVIINTLIFLVLSATPAFAGGDSEAESKLRSEKESVKIDRSKRASPYAATPFNVLSSGREASRYRTDQAWSRGRGYGYWGYYGRNRSDLPTTGYTAPVKKGDRK